MAKSKGNMLGSWAFLAGVILAVVWGVLIQVLQGNDVLAGYSSGLSVVLVFIGLVVGFLNISDDETQPFLITGVVLVITAAMGANLFSMTVPVLGNVLTSLLMIFVPATIIVAVKNVFALAKN